MKKILSIILIMLIVFMCIGCGREKEPDKINIGVSMPSSGALYQNQGGNAIKNALVQAGYSVELQYADNDAEIQVKQIKYLIERDCRVIVVQPIDSEALADILQEAKEKEIAVISYDDLIMNSDSVSYYVAFDKSIIGRLQGKYIAEKLKLDECAEGEAYTIEICSGIAGDADSRIYYDGAMDVLKQYIDSGVLYVPSGEISYEETCEENEDALYNRIVNMLNDYYSDEIILDAVLCVDDSSALSVSEAIDYNYNGDFPIITGNGCTLYSVRKIADNRQTMSVFENPKLLSDKTAELVNALLNGTGVSASESLNNGSIDVPAFICEPYVIDAGNYKSEIIDSGYYTETQIYD